METSIETRRTDSQNKDFIFLVERLDEDLAQRDGREHDFYNTFNTIHGLSHVVLAHWDKQPIACGAMKPIHKGKLEIKRMFTLSDFRGRGAASLVLEELEKWAAEDACSYCVLETGKRQTEAVALYRAAGYVQIPNYPPYAGIENSLCFEKRIGPHH